MCDVSSGHWRPLVPLTWRRRVFLAVHNLAHPGIRASRRLISARFMWKGMAADVGQWCRECEACQKAKIMTQHTAPVQPILVPSRRFTHLHVDLVNPLTASSEGHTHVMTIVDRSTRWTRWSTTATSCADALVAGWISMVVLHFSLYNVSLRPPFWGGPCGSRAGNRILKERLAGVLDGHKILTHSFRSGAASMMGSLG